MSSDDDNDSDDDLPAELIGSLGDLVPGANGIPLPKIIKKSFWKSVAKLITGSVDIGVAKLESISSDTRAKTAAKNEVTRAAGKAAAIRLGESDELGDRALDFFANDIIGQQRNRETIAKFAADEIAQDPPKEDAQSEIDEDWLNMFSDIAAKKSNEEMQLYMGKILAGEVRQPGSFSVATIVLLAGLGGREAHLFQKLCNISMGIRTDKKIDSFTLVEPYGKPGNNDLQSLDLDYEALSDLRVAGLITPDLTTQKPFSWATSVKFEICNRLAAFTKVHDKDIDLGSVGVISLSRSGQELRTILTLAPTPDYIEKLQEWLRTKNLQMIYILSDGTYVVATKNM